MGVVVAMTPRKPARTSAPPAGSAEILFFTGVRYYRMTDDAPVAAAAPAPKRRKATKAKPDSKARRHG